MNHTSNTTTLNTDIHSFVTIISISTSSFSLLGCSFVVFLYIAFQSLQQPQFKLVFNISASILILSIGNLIVTSSPDSIIDPSYCKLQGFMINFGGISNIFWSFLSCLYLLRVFGNIDGIYRFSDKITYGFGYGVPFFMSFMYLTPISLKNYTKIAHWQSGHMPIRTTSAGSNTKTIKSSCF